MQTSNPSLNVENMQRRYMCLVGNENSQQWALFERVSYEGVERLRQEKFPGTRRFSSIAKVLLQKGPVFEKLARYKYKR